MQCREASGENPPWLPGTTDPLRTLWREVGNKEKEQGGQNTRTKEEERIRRVFKQVEARLRCGPAPETLLSSFT